MRRSWALSFVLTSAACSAEPTTSLDPDTPDLARAPSGVVAAPPAEPEPTAAEAAKASAVAAPRPPVEEEPSPPPALEGAEPDAVPELLALAREVFVLDRPSADGKKIGYLRAGSRVPRSAEPAGFDGCSGGYYRIAPEVMCAPVHSRDSTRTTLWRASGACAPIAWRRYRTPTQRRGPSRRSCIRDCRSRLICVGPSRSIAGVPRARFPSGSRRRASRTSSPRVAPRPPLSAATSPPRSTRGARCPTARSRCSRLQPRRPHLRAQRGLSAASRRSPRAGAAEHVPRNRTRAGRDASGVRDAPWGAALRG